MMKNKKFVFGLSVIFILISSLSLIWAPNDVQGLHPVFNDDGDIISINYIITGPGGDHDAHVNVNTRELDANLTITNINTTYRHLLDLRHIQVNWCQNWSGPEGNYPTPNCVLMSGNTADNGTFFSISKSELIPGTYQIYMPFTYYEIVPGKDDRVVSNYIDGSNRTFVIKTNTTLKIDPIKDITVGNNVTITGTLTEDFDDLGLNDKLINITIGDQKYNVTTKSDGKFNLTVENLTVGDYTVEGIYNQNILNGIYLTSNKAIEDFKVKEKPPIPPVPTPVNPIGNNTHNKITPATTPLDVTGGPLAGILLWAMVLCIVYTLNRKE
jgi:hypothetical protein